MKKIITLLSILAVSAFVLVGCSDSVGDESINVTNTGAAIDLSTGQYAVGFSDNYDGDWTTYEDLQENTYGVVDGYLIGFEPDYHATSSLAAVVLDYSGSDMDPASGEVATLFGAANPNYVYMATQAGILAAGGTPSLAGLDYTQSFVYSAIVKLNENDELAGIVLSCADGNTPAVPVAGVGIILTVVGNGTVMLSMDGGVTTNYTMNISGVTGWAQGDDLTFTLLVNNEGASDRGPDVTVVFGTTPLFGYDGDLGGAASADPANLTLNTASAVIKGDWTDAWEALVVGATAFTNPQNFVSQWGFSGFVDAGTTVTDAAGIKGVQIDMSGSYFQ